VGAEQEGRTKLFKCLQTSGLIDIPIRPTRLRIDLCLGFPTINIQPESLKRSDVFLGAVIPRCVLGYTEEDIAAFCDISLYQFVNFPSCGN